MSQIPYQGIPVTCPNCKTRFRAPVLSIIDVGQFPQARALLLSGQLNVAVCPQCGSAGMLNAPLVYHDPDKELLLTFVPPELGMSEIEQQRMVGDLTNRVISALPPDKRKGYLLRPRNYLRLEALIKDVLEAEGITQEMLDAQRARSELLERLIQAEQGSRRAIAQANDEQIGYEFLDLLALNLELAERAQQNGLAEELRALRQDLLQWTSVGRELAAREEAIQSLGPETTREELLEKLVEAALADQPVKIETMVTIARPAIDYVFYQNLSEQITAAEKAGDPDRLAKLKSLRETILDLTAQIDKEAEHAVEAARDLLLEAMRSDDAEAFIREHAGDVDNMFMSILSANLQAAQESGQTAAVEQLQRVSDAVMGLILESQPPEVQFINHLLNADYPEGTRALLEANRAALDDRLLQIMQQLVDDLRTNGRQDAADQLMLVQAQAKELAGRQAI